MLEIAERVAERLGALWLSVVRTWVPYVLGAVFAWLTTQGFTIDEDTRAGIVAAGIVLAGMAWYLVGRLAETFGARRNWRWLQIAGGLMLGVPKPPEYSDPLEAVRRVEVARMRHQAPNVPESPGASAARRAAMVDKRE